MAVNYTLLDLETQLRAIGRGVVFEADKWDGATNLALTHLGDTEGEITVEVNEELSHLTLPEVTGPAKHKSYVTGEDPVVTVPIFYADPDLRSLVSPTGNASGGYQRQRPVKEKTLVIFPEDLFLDRVTNTHKALTYDGTAWKLGTAALTTEQTKLLGLSMWFWRGYFAKAGPVFRYEDAGKAVQPISFQVMQSDVAIAKIPDGERLYTVGDPKAKNIKIHPVGS